MKLTIGNKLALSFGVIVGLMTLSSAMVYYNMFVMQRNIDEVVNEATPTVRACDLLLNGVNRSIGTLRGYLIMGDTEKEAAYFQAVRVEAWQEIDDSLAKLQKFSAQWQQESERKLLGEIERSVENLRSVQHQIEDVGQTEANIPAKQLLLEEIAPRAEESFSVLTKLIEFETGQNSNQDRFTLQKTVADIRGQIALTLSDARWYLAVGSVDALQKLKARWGLHEQAYVKMEQWEPSLSPQQRQLWDRNRQLHDKLVPLLDKLAVLRGAEDWNKAQFLMESSAVPTAKGLRDKLDKITAAAESRKLSMQEEMAASGRATITSLIVATAAAVIAAITIAVYLTRKLVSMIRALTEQASSIASGDLRGEGLKLKSADELGQLAEGFDTMLARLKDLTSQVISVTENVNSTAAQISSSASQQASSTKQQASTVQEITSTMQELGQTGTQIIDKAKELSTAAEASMETSKNGMSAVQETNRSMEAIREQVEDVAENIVALSERTQAIGNIVATVNEVAEQSNLLALNATIEAVSAGEQGSRFSVVANEMKNLADQAKQCTVQVRDHLGEIQKGINSSVMLTEEAVKRVEAGKQRAKVTEDTIRKMSDTTNESVRTFQQIIGATNQQQIGFEQVTQGMEEIREATQQTATGTSQLEQAVGSLSALSHQLKAAVGSYQL